MEGEKKSMAGFIWREIIFLQQRLILTGAGMTEGLKERKGEVRKDRQTDGRKGGKTDRAGR